MKHLTHKKIALIVALVAAAALLAVGTFAWSDRLTQINEFSGTAADKELALHDDYEPGTGGKAVYAENAGKPVHQAGLRGDIQRRVQRHRHTRAHGYCDRQARRHRQRRQDHLERQHKEAGHRAGPGAG